MRRRITNRDSSEDLWNRERTRPAADARKRRNRTRGEGPCRPTGLPLAHAALDAWLPAGQRGAPIERVQIIRQPERRAKRAIASSVPPAWNVSWNISANDFQFIQILRSGRSLPRGSPESARGSDRLEGEHLVPLRRVPEALRCDDCRNLSRAAAGAAARHRARGLRRTSAAAPGEREECAGGPAPARGH